VTRIQRLLAKQQRGEALDMAEVWRCAPHGAVVTERGTWISVADEAPPPISGLVIVASAQPWSANVRDFAVNRLKAGDVILMVSDDIVRLHAALDEVALCLMMPVGNA
jgi:hypothetical protein